MTEPMMTHQIEIPEAFLIILAAHGNMGDGKLPFLMQSWAEQECQRLGIQDKMLQEKEKRYWQVINRAKAILGSNTVDEIENATKAIAPAVANAMKGRAII